MRHRRGLWPGLLCVAGLIILEAGCGSGGSGGGGGSNTTPAPTVTLAASPTTVTSGQNATLTWSSTNATSCTASGSCSGSEATSGSKTETPPATGTFTYTLACTGTGGTANASATVTVTAQRVITLSLVSSVPPIPNNIIYSDFGGIVTFTFNCTGCESGDALTVESNGQTGTDPYVAGVSWAWQFNTTGLAYIPRIIKFFIKGVDGVVSNTFWYAFIGSQNMAAEDSSSGEIYYAYPGNGTQGSFAVLKFKQDGTADGTFSDGGFGIAVDNLTHDVVFTHSGQISVDDSNGNQLTVVGIPNSSSNAYALDVSSADGLACATQPTIDSASCLYLPTTISAPPVFSFPGLPSGSQPTAIKVLDATHVVLYGRGDRTLRWYTISGTTATAAGTLVLSEFTAADASYWQQYPVTGGWDLVEVGSTLCVMGQVVNGDGTVSQKLELVNNTNQTLTQYVALPTGTVHIAADPTNNAVVAEYIDFSGASPIMRFERVYVGTGNTATLAPTSTLVPGAGFLITLDGSHIAVFVEDEADFEPNQ